MFTEICYGYDGYFLHSVGRNLSHPAAAACHGGRGGRGRGGGRGSARGTAGGGAGEQSHCVMFLVLITDETLR